jgi:uncharacterized pyridoxal phosphate-containing UPF0001 family protein
MLPCPTTSVHFPLPTFSFRITTNPL